MKRVHPEFAYQSRELGGQIEGVLGDPPDQKNYNRMVQALVDEYANGSGIEDLNMMAFALADHISFNNPKGLLREAQDYEGGDPDKVFAMASCDGPAAAMYKAMTENHPELARQAIITAFLYQNPRAWDDEDQGLDQLHEDDEDEENDEEGMVTDDFAQLFDKDDE